MDDGVCYDDSHSREAAVADKGPESVFDRNGSSTSSRQVIGARVEGRSSKGAQGGGGSEYCQGLRFPERSDLPMKRLQVKQLRCGKSYTRPIRPGLPHNKIFAT